MPKPPTPLEKVNARLGEALPFDNRPAAPASPSGGGGGVASNGLPSDFELGYNGYVDDQGLTHYFVINPATGAIENELAFTQSQSGQYVLYTPPAGGGGGGSDNTVGLANVGLGYANLGENARQFDVSTANQAAQYNQDFTEGQRQFDLKFSRANYESDRAYEEDKAQFAQTYAETQREFDLTHGLNVRAQDFTEEMGRGRLGLDTQRLGLDTELGRGNLRVSEGQLGVNRGQLDLNRQLGFAGARIDAARLGQEGAIADRQARLAENQFRADVLRNPSDYVFRAFQSRGATPPRAQVSQAQLLNSLKEGAPVPMEKGGTTKARLILAGEKGPELIYRHEDGSLSIADSKTTKRLLTGGREETVKTQLGEAKRYAAGTDDKFFQELARLSTYTPSAIPTFNQDELVQAAKDYSPPAVSSALEGGRMGSYRTATPGLTLRNVGRLVPGELKALNTRLGVQFNTTLQDELAGLQERFLGTRQTPLARLRV